MNANATVLIVPPGGDTGPYGDRTPAVGTETPWEGCKVAPRATQERSDPTQPATITGVTVYGPEPPVELSPDHQLRIDGKLYDIDGDVGEWKSPYTGRYAGVEVAANRWSQP